MLRLKFSRKYFLLALICLTLAKYADAQTENFQLVQLRQQLALNYLKPMPHLALAKYYWTKGDRLQAFYISEYARRARFPETVFDQAFQTYFSGTASSQTASTWLEESQTSAKTSPGNERQAAEIFIKAAELQKQNKLEQAEEFFIKKF